MRRTVLVAFLVVVSACGLVANPSDGASAVNPPNSITTADKAHGISSDVVRLIEEQVVMPTTAHPLPAYNRYYAIHQISGREVIMGVFLRSIPLRQGAVPLTGLAGAYAVSEPPRVADGGCSVVTVFFDVATRRLLPVLQDGVPAESGEESLAACNGIA